MRPNRPTPHQREFAEFVRNMRESIHWSQAKLAEHIGIDPWNIHSYETIRHIPRNPVDFERRLRDVVKTEIRRQREEFKTDGFPTRYKN